MSESVNDTKFSLVETANLQSTSKAYFRGTNQVVKNQGDPTTSADSNAAITAAEMKTGIITCTATATRTKPTSTAALICSTLGLEDQNDSFDFAIINTAANSSGFDVVIANSADATNITIVGNPRVAAVDDVADQIACGSGRFLVRRTDAATATPQITIYRIA